jgi:hypothetical protein
MRWVFRLIATNDDNRCLSTDLVDICRPEGLGDIANLGLTLLEAKQVLNGRWFPGRSTTTGWCDGLVVRHESAKQPYQLNIPSRLSVPRQAA